MIDWDAAVLGPCMAVFGEKPELRPLYRRAGGGAPFAVDGVFDDAYMAVVMAGDEPAMTSMSPVLGVRLAQFGGEDPVQGDEVVVPRVGRTYVVADVQPDGHGWAKLVLQRMAD